MTLALLFKSAVLSSCLVSNPSQCMRHTFQIETGVCGKSYYSKEYNDMSQQWLLVKNTVRCTGKAS